MLGLMARRRIVKKTPVQKKAIEEVAAKVQPMVPNLLIILLVVVSFFSGYLFFKLKSLEQSKTTAAVQQTNDAGQPVRPPVSIEQIKKLFAKGFLATGNADSKVLFVEISDPSCPFCHMAGGKNPELAGSSTQFKYNSDGGTYTPPVSEMKKLVDEGKASFVMLYSNGHGNGRLSAEALYCAHEKGNFWEAHDLLMTNEGYNLINDTVKNDKAQSQTLADFLAPAVDAAFMNECLTSGKYTESLTRDEALAQQMGFSGTPDFFVNTTNFSGAQDYKTMEPAVKAALGE